MHCTRDLPIYVSRAHCFEDFCGDRANCSSTTTEEWDALLCKASQIFACAHHALYHPAQICHRCVQLLIVLEAPLQIHAVTVFVLRTHFQIPSTISKLFCVARKTNILPPFSFTLLLFDQVALAFMWLAHILGEYHITHRTLYFCLTLKISADNLY
jgi:hypothetical protein